MQGARPLTFPKFRSSGTSFTLPAVTITVAATDFEVSVTEVAVSHTGEFAGTEGGLYRWLDCRSRWSRRHAAAALYKRSVPFCESVHATPLWAESFPTVATNCCEMFSGSKALSAPKSPSEGLLAPHCTLSRPRRPMQQ